MYSFGIFPASSGIIKITQIQSRTRSSGHDQHQEAKRQYRGFEIEHPDSTWIKICSSCKESYILTLWPFIIKRASLTCNAPPGYLSRQPQRPSLPQLGPSPRSYACDPCPSSAPSVSCQVSLARVPGIFNSELSCLHVS